jgi:hypothetical protein
MTGMPAAAQTFLAGRNGQGDVHAHEKAHRLIDARCDVTKPLLGGQAEMATFEFIEGWYSPHRWHSRLDHQSPMRYEETARTPADIPSVQVSKNRINSSSCGKDRPCTPGFEEPSDVRIAVC